MNTASQKLKAILRMSSYTQRQLADKMGVSLVSLNRWIQGRSQPRKKMQERIHAFCDAYTYPHDKHYAHRPSVAISYDGDAPHTDWDLFYTMEHVQTGAIHLQKAPRNILYTSFVEILGVCRSEFYISELICQLVFRAAAGCHITRLPLSRRDLYYRAHSFAERYKINQDAFYGSGCPDFFVEDTEAETYQFIEVKRTEKKLSESQKRWISTYGYDVYVFKFAGTCRESEGGFNTEEEQGVLIRNKLQDV